MSKKDFAGLIRGISDSRSPLSINLLHAYVHNSFVVPRDRDLVAAWDEAQPFFENIWK